MEEKIIGDCAVILANESKKAGKKLDGKVINIDPVFMIKQGEEWRVMPDLTQWDLTRRIPADMQPTSMKLDEKKVAAYKDLEKWVDERHEALKKERKQNPNGGDAISNQE